MSLLLFTPLDPPIKSYVDATFATPEDDVFIIMIFVLFKCKWTIQRITFEDVMRDFISIGKQPDRSADDDDNVIDALIQLNGITESGSLSLRCI